MKTVDAVAVVVRPPGDPARVLGVLRPEGDDELPGVWGLPAASLRPGEDAEDGVRRIGIAKLGAALRPSRVLAEGSQERAGYLLRMALHEAVLAAAEPVLPSVGDPGDPGTRYAAYRWVDPKALQAGADLGSLCCRLLLDLHPGGDRPGAVEGARSG